MKTFVLGVIIMTAANLHANNLPAEALTGTYISIDGEPVDLSDYKGRVVLIVNVASRCGFTKQYAALQKLYEEKKDDGLIVLGFPCNQFAGQEPGSDAKIKEFCQSRFGVTFPMFSKIKVRGKDAADLYKYLSSKDAPIDDAGPVRWNFEKFLIDRRGRLIDRFRSRVAPDSEELLAAVAAALQQD